MSSERYRQFFDDLYGWFGGLCTGDVENTEEVVAQSWTEDSRMVTNGMLEAEGIPSLKEHFDKFPGKYTGITVQKPYHKYIEVGDTVIVEYDIIGHTRPGQQAMVVDDDGGHQHIRVMAIFEMRDGRIAEMREVAAANLGDQ